MITSAMCSFFRGEAESGLVAFPSNFGVFGQNFGLGWWKLWEGLEGVSNHTKKVAKSQKVKKLILKNSFSSQKSIEKFF